MRPTRLERLLATLVGAFLGGVASVALVFGLGYWGVLLWVPVVLGALAGHLFGDRGVLRLSRILSYLP
ncbi:MAG: hypothetical protein R3304_07765 [Longimicrobiales bacterium]|nr:hypothetical protein [Longimicrobiales bacterium]